MSGGSESAGLNTDEDGKIKWDIVKVIDKPTTEANSGSSYQITTSNKEVNVPYKATIQVQFTVRFEGSLEKKNFHETHKGKSNRPSFEYTFGSEGVPFYKFLKQVSERGDSPWLWSEMMHGQDEEMNKYGQEVIDLLTDESLYEFELHGTFQDMAGLEFNVDFGDKPVANVPSANATLAV